MRKGGGGESKSDCPTPIILVRSAILVCRGVILDCRRGVLGLHVSSVEGDTYGGYNVFMYIYASYLSEINFHTSMMTCMGLLFISLASDFYRFYREGGLLSGLLLG